jgi:hypothetical protein
MRVKKEINIDYLESRPLTKSEESALSAYIKKQKEQTIKLKKKAA